MNLTEGDRGKTDQHAAEPLSPWPSTNDHPTNGHHMGTFLVVLVIIGAIVGGLIWNHRNQATAMAGAEFDLPEPPGEVAAAIVALYCQGAKAVMKRMFSGVTVTPMGSSGFTFNTKFGDQGEIEVHSGHGSGTTVRISTSSLYIGGKPLSGSSGGIWALSRVLSNAILTLVGYAPNAARMKRFQRNLEQNVARQISRQVGA